MPELKELLRDTTPDQVSDLDYDRLGRRGARRRALARVASTAGIVAAVALGGVGLDHLMTQEPAPVILTPKEMDAPKVTEAVVDPDIEQILEAMSERLRREGTDFEMTREEAALVEQLYGETAFDPERAAAGGWSTVQMPPGARLPWGAISPDSGARLATDSHLVITTATNETYLLDPAAGAYWRVRPAADLPAVHDLTERTLLWLAADGGELVDMKSMQRTPVPAMPVPITEASDINRVSVFWTGSRVVMHQLFGGAWTWVPGESGWQDFGGLPDIATQTVLVSGDRLLAHGSFRQDPEGEGWTGELGGEGRARLADLSSGDVFDVDDDFFGGLRGAVSGDGTFFSVHGKDVLALDKAGQIVVHLALPTAMTGGHLAQVRGRFASVLVLGTSGQSSVRVWNRDTGVVATVPDMARMDAANDRWAVLFNSDESALQVVGADGVTRSFPTPRGAHANLVGDLLVIWGTGPTWWVRDLS